MKHECIKCGLVFTTHRGQEQHRTGKFEVEPPDYGRRCLTEEELVGMGYRRRDDGQWNLDPLAQWSRMPPGAPTGHPRRKYTKSTA